MRKTVVLLIDSQPIFRAGVRRALSHQNGLEALEILDCDPGRDGEEAIRQIAENSPDVALLDINCPALNGLELTRYISQHFPATKVVILSATHSAEELFEVIKTGAAAYLSRDSGAVELSEAIRRAASGEYPINDSLDDRPIVARRVLEQLQDTTITAKTKEYVTPPLTPKEIQFLNLIAEDNSNKRIAAILGISEQTIKNYVSAILRKLNACDRAHTVMLSLCNNWLSIQESVEGSQTDELLSMEPIHLEQQHSVKRSSRGKQKSQQQSSIKSGKTAVLAQEAQERA